MLLGTILKRLESEANAALVLEHLGDLVLLAEVAAMGAVHGETPGEYVSGATRRFAAAASDEDWLVLMTALERTQDPARTMLERMVRWSLASEQADPGACGCSGGRVAHDHSRG